MRAFLFIPFLLIAVLSSKAQKYDRQDSLRGSITPERIWWDLRYYELDIEVDIDNQSLSGTNTITYKVLESFNTLQIDLQKPMILDQATQDGKTLEVRSEGNAHFIQLKDPQTVGEKKQLTITYHGSPVVAQNAPWDGGITWTKDSNGKPFVANANQGLGSSSWWPCKVHPYDENDDGMVMRFTVPEDLVAVGNGRLIKTKRNRKEGTSTFTWKVVNPINNYGVNLSIGDYVSFSEVYPGENGDLDMIYYVLRENLEKAKVHFSEAKKTIEAFEYWFGPYPFYEDSYKLVEVPYLGMEHQSSVTYGNGYQMGYKGTDLSKTGWGLKWDYIIVHESGHEWFANNITHKDAADIWIHESFTCYSEGLYTEYHFGKEAGATYIRGMRYGIDNRETLIGDYQVSNRGDDLYDKGSNILHTLRQLVNDDERWRSILRGLNKDFYHQTVTTAEVENYIALQSGLLLDKFFDQYLRDPRIPVLEYVLEDGKTQIRWTNCIEGFNMPVRIFNAEGKAFTLSPNTYWSQTPVEFGSNEIIVDPNFYVYSNQVKFK